MNNQIKRVLIKTGKIAAWIVGSIVLFLLLLSLLIATPYVQNKIINRAQTFFNDKTGRKLEIDHIYLKFPKTVNIQGLYVEDQYGDTLAYMGYLDVNVAMLQLLQNKIDVQKIDLDNFRGRLIQKNDTSGFNFQYIIDSFSSPKKEQKENSTEWSFGLNTLEMSEISFLMKDNTSGLEMTTQLKTLTIDMNDLNLNSMIFGADEIIVDGLKYKLNIEDSKSDNAVSTNNDSSSYISIATDLLEIHHSQVDIQQAEANYKANIGFLELEEARLNTKGQNIDLGSLNSKNCQYMVKLPAPDTTDAPPDNDSGAGIPWKINVDKIALDDYRVTYSINDTTNTNGPIDPGNIDLKNLQVSLENISLNEQVMAANVNQLAFLEQNSGISLNELKGEFKKEGNQYDLNDFKISALNTELNFSTNINLKDSFPEFSVDITSAVITPQDLKLFVPAIDTFPAYDNWPKINLLASISGNADSVNVDTLNAAFYKSNIRLTGGIKHYLDSQKIHWDLPQLKVLLRKQDLAFLEKDSVFPQDLVIPERTEINIESKGSMKQASLKAKVYTTQGTINTEASVNYDTLIGEYQINATVATDQLRPNQVLTSLPVDTTTLELQLAGFWQDSTSALANIDLKVQKCHFNQYSYQNLQLDGEATLNSFSGKLHYEDENLELTYAGNTDFSDSLKHFDFKIDIPKADLQALHFTDIPFKCRGNIDSKMTLVNEKVLAGLVELKDVSLVKNNKYYVISNLSLQADTTGLENTLSLNSDILDFRFTGNIALLEAPEIFGELANYYVKSDSARQNNNLFNSSDYFSFSLDLKDTEILKDIFLTDLKTLNINQFTGSFNGDSSLLKLNIEIPKLSYANYTIDSLDWKIQNKEKAIKGNLNIAALSMGNISIKDFLLNSIYRNDSLLLNTSIQSSDSISRYRINTAVVRQDDFTRLFVLDSLILNKNTWRPAENSYVQIGPVFWLDSLILQRKEQSISFNSSQSSQDTLHEISIKNLNLTQFNSGKDSLKKVTGNLNSTLQLSSNPGGQAQINGNLDIDNLAYGDNNLGKLNASIKSIEEALDIALNIAGVDNDISIEGSIATKEQTEFDLKADLQRFQVNVLQPLLTETLDELHGVITGKFDIKGTVEQPDINGQLNFKNISFQPTLTGVPYQIEQDKMSFKRNRFVFDDFKIKDKDENSATLKGFVEFDDINTLRYQIDLNTKSFLVVDKKPSRQDDFYGTARLSSDAKIRGDSELIKIQANLNVDNQSDLTYILPQSNREAANRQNIVRFVDKDLQNDPFFENIDFEDTVQNRIQDITLNANISVAPESRFSIVVDPKSGDQLNLRGEANLAFEINPAGDINLSGRYTIEEGDYKLNFYQIVKREFIIEKGSTLLWKGDPTNAELDITAIYEMKASPPVGSSNAPVKFEVILNLENELLNPEISFQIDAPEDVKQRNPELYIWLQDVNNSENKQNMQAFSMLVFRSFANTGASAINIESTARNSVSQILTQQLNALGSKLEGVELSFDVDSYQTNSDQGSSGRTDVQLGVAKSFMNDRISVKVSGNVNVEGAEKSEQLSDYTGDLIIEYKLTPDGNYRIEGFRINNYDGLTQGEITETGIGFIMVKEYSDLKELFNFANKNK
jgi:translocation and assembly module TamB